MQRIVGILAIGGMLILISWVTSPAARTPSADAPPSRGVVEQTEQSSASIAAASHADVAQIDDQAAKLRARLAAPPPRPEPDRNPFSFARARPGSDPVGTRPVPTGSDPFGTDLSSPAALPKVVLPTVVAITSDARDGGVMRTAVLSMPPMNDEIKIVRPGQMFDRFLVESIGPDSVRLVDITSPTRAAFTVAIR